MTLASVEYVHHPDAPPLFPPLAARAGDLIFTGGQMAIHPVDGVPPTIKGLPGYPWHGSDIERQLGYLYGNLDQTLGQLSSSLHRTMKINSYHINPPDIDMALRVRKKWFDAETPPPSTLVLARELPMHGPTVLIDMITLADNAELDRRAVTMVKTEQLPQVSIFGWTTFLRALRGGGFVFTAGRTPTTARGVLPEIMPHPEFPYRYHQIRLQAEVVLNELRDILADAGCSLADVVRAEVHLPDMSDLAELDAVWGRFFPEDPPARVIVPLPLASPPYRLEVELIAVDPQGPYHKETVTTSDVSERLGNEPQAVRAGPYLFLSGQLATDFKCGVPPEAQPDPNFPFHSSKIKHQVEYIFGTVDRLCKAAGTSIENLVRRRVHYVDLNDLAEAENIWAERLGDRLPPTTSFRIEGSLPVPGCLVQYDLIAFIQ